MKKDRLSTFLGCTSPLSPLMLASAGFVLFVSDLCLKNYVLYNKLDALKKIMTLLSILMCIVLAIEATGSVKNRKSVKLENKKNVCIVCMHVTLRNIVQNKNLFPSPTAQ